MYPNEKSAISPLERLLISSAILTAFALRALSASEDCLPLVVRNPEGNYIVPGTLGDIVYKRVDGRELSLDAFVHISDGNSRPGVVVIHGGGWTSGSRIAHVPQILEDLTDAGLNWFSVDYRLAQEAPLVSAVDDLEAALRFIRCHARELRTDPDRLALLGEDTGAHLAALLLAREPDGVRGLVTLAGVFDLLADPEGDMARIFEQAYGPFPRDLRRTALFEASPVHSKRAHQVPTLAIHGSGDKEALPAQSEGWCRRVRSSGAPCEVFLVAQGIHRPENWTPVQWSYRHRMKEWLKDNLSPVPSPRLPASDAGPQPSSAFRVAKNLRFRHYVDRHGEESELRLDFYRPAGPGPHPAVIVVHGGGWEAGDKVTYVTPIFEPLARAGFAWFSIDYRLTPEFGIPDQLDDLRRAIRHVRHNAERYRIDPSKIALLGESASGQLALQVAATPCPGIPESADSVERESCRVQAVVSFYGVYDFVSMSRAGSYQSMLARLFGVSGAGNRSRLEQLSPLYSAGPGMPPVLLVNGTAEFLWEQAQRMSARLVELEVPHEVLPIPGAPHGMENWEGHPEWMFYKEKVAEWLKGELSRER